MAFKYFGSYTSNSTKHFLYHDNKRVDTSQDMYVVLCERAKGDEIPNLAIMMFIYRKKVEYYSVMYKIKRKRLHMISPSEPFIPSVASSYVKLIADVIPYNVYIKDLLLGHKVALYIREKGLK